MFIKRIIFLKFFYPIYKNNFIDLKLIRKFIYYIDKKMRNNKEQ